MNRNYTFCLWYIYFISFREVTLLAFLSLKFKELEKYITYVTYIVTSITHKPMIEKFWNFQHKKVQYLRFILDMYTMLITRGIYYMHFVTKSDTKNWSFWTSYKSLKLTEKFLKSLKHSSNIFYHYMCCIFTHRYQICRFWYISMFKIHIHRTWALLHIMQKNVYHSKNEIKVIFLWLIIK